jgi:hypothetical protein
MFRNHLTCGALLAVAVALFSVPSLAHAGHPGGCFPHVSHCQPCYTPCYTPCYRPVVYTQPCHSIYVQPSYRPVYVQPYVPTYSQPCYPYSGCRVIIR